MSWKRPARGGVRCRRLSCLSAVFFLAASVWGVSLSFGAREMKTFHNPILRGFHPDPTVCRVGDDFYLTTSTFEYFPGLPIYHSRDLVHWRLIGNALDRESQLPLRGATDVGGLFAPTLRYRNGVFYLTCNNVSGGGNFIVTAEDPSGPWSEPIWLNDHEIDGSLFFDDDGKVYYTRCAGGEGGIAQAQIDISSGKFLTPMRLIYHNKKEPWNEGPHLYKINGFYWLLLAEGGTGDRHQAVIGRAKSPWGPFESSPHNPFLTERDRPESPIQCAGHADMFEAPDATWWAVFLGVRRKSGFSVMGRETYLAPVIWTKDGWPVVNGDHHVALEMPAPLLKPHPFPPPPERYAFDGEKLGPEWLHVRNISPKAFSLSERKGFLRLYAVPQVLHRKDQAPAFAGLRQREHQVRVETNMEFHPDSTKDEAGLCLRANDNYFYTLSAAPCAEKENFELLVRNRVRGVDYMVARRRVPKGKIHLKVEGDENQYHFYWSRNGKQWAFLAASPAADLSRERAGGFTGLVIGLFATANGGASHGFADFDFFEMKEGRKLETRTLSPRPTPTPIPARRVWRIRCGEGSYIDRKGDTWVEDIAFEGGEAALTGRSIAGTKEEGLYQSERWGPDFQYTLPVVEGRYRLILKFAETYVKKEGARVFDVYINGKKILDRFDILKEAGAFDRAVDKVFEDIEPENGVVHIRFVSHVQNAKVCAIAVEPQ